MLRGIEQRNEIDPNMLLRDTRTLGQRFGAFFKNPTNVACLLAALGLTGFFVPEVSDLCLVFGILCFFWT